MNDRIKNLLMWILIIVVFFSLLSNFGPNRFGKENFSYTQFMSSVEEGNVTRVTISDQTITGMTRSGQSFVTYLPIKDGNLLNTLVSKGVDVVGKPPEQQSLLLHIFINWFPFLIMVALLFWLFRQMQGGGGSGRGAFSFGRSRARMLTQNQIKVTFSDVAGIDEAKQEVTEFVDFLKNPKQFQKLGGKMPCGALLVGSPGTGKTLLARAVAGEANVPFFTISGSDFVEMFVGVGASRVRDMFEQAKKQAPCIIFIDEIDAVGRHRGAGLGGGHDEREQTLNQLLVEMDGFEGKEGVIVMAATNRPDVLDPALLRPGRFDRQVIVPLPDIKGREQILNVHLNSIAAAANVKPSLLARGTPGFSGADLANLVNEAALMAARKNKRKVSMLEMDQAKDKIMMGTERSMAMNVKEKQLTAYHEAGHALVGLTVPEHDPVYKISIIPRGRALGVTMFLPLEDRYSMSRTRLESQLSSLFGGRVAEEVVYGYDNVTTGASNDIEKATELARNYVTRWGLDKALGPINYGSDDSEVFLGKSMNKRVDHSEKTSQAIDKAVQMIVDKNYKRAHDIIIQGRDKLELMAEALMQYETIETKQIASIMKGQKPEAPDGWEAPEKKEEKKEEKKATKKVKDKEKK